MKTSKKKVTKKATKKVTKKKTNNIKAILREHNQGIKLDIGCGANKQDGFVGIDVRPMKGVDIVHNIEQFPWPLPDNCASMCVASHVLEHVNPSSTSPQLVGLIKLLKQKKVLTDKEIEQYIGKYEIFGTFMTFMDEVWRITMPKGRFAFVVPYAGSPGYWQDPTHINPITENTLAYFDPLDTSGLWNIYKPRPWKIVSSAFDMHNGFLEVILEKRVIDKSYEPQN